MKHLLIIFSLSTTVGWSKDSEYNNLVERDLTAVKSTVKINIFSGTKKAEILKAPTI